MSKLKRTLLYSLLLSALAVMPVSAFAGYGNGNGNGNGDNDVDKKTERKLDESQLPKADQTSYRYGGRYGFGFYYGRPYYYQPYYYSYPYRPYYYRYYYYNRPYYWW